ncbi:disease resistance protein L6-like [Syzygium oleosum]|uniref:disease resistance protein L6-like n=1 Tax=Syzygium oleosum TaxID=219896 RepID=UPI0024B8DE8B|nr:disease resistance protein L6-like [Syzygium oleosum]
MNAEPRRTDMGGVFLNLFYWLCRLCSANSLEMEREEPTHSEDPTYEASSSSTPSHVGDYEGGTKKPRGNDYEVFLSFRGKDTRKGFTDYLYTSLVDAGIHVFRDDNELRVGEEIGAELLYSITQSKISIPIISEDYFSSKWCLRELTEILKCKRTRGQIVLPIFYKVKPLQVRHLTGRLGDAINARSENLDKMVVKEWEEALKEVSSLKGWESDKTNNGHEGALVKTVVRKVMGELKRLFLLIVPEQLVGIDDHVERIMRSIDDKFNGTKIIGIHGMGGIGKTTLAKVLYNKLSCKFEHLSFVANIRETSLRKGIECLQNQLICDIIGSSCDVSNVDEGIRIIKSRFTSKKVLVLLDDMDDNSHLNALAGDGSWFEVGSIVIITTRNKGILDETRASHIHQLNELPLDQSLILFSRHAFRKDSPQSDYKIISSDIVSTTGGLPLALEVIGSFLCGKREEVWKDTLKKLNKVPDKKVQEKLRISYDALDYEEQQIFLDVACFFIGSHKQSLTYMWQTCDFFPGKGIEVLSLLSLIKIDKDGNLMMHDQLRDLGREIIRQENPKEPQERSRLWNYEEAIDVLDNNKGTRKIEALCLGKYGMGRRYTTEQFKELTNLKCLQFDGVNFTGDFQNLFPQLRWLQWMNCPSDFTATNFHPKKLVVLDLSWSEITEDWGGWGPLKMAIELKVLNLTGCQSLRRTPELSAFKSLEILILDNCWHLQEIHPSIGDIKTLVSLKINHCFLLEELPVGIGRMEELRELHLNYTAIEEIPISRGCLMKLETLSASNCEELAQLPESMNSLVSLTQLDLSYSAIEKLPESIGFLKKLKTLNASYCKSLAHIPSSIGRLASLAILDLRECGKLAQLPDSIGSLTSLTTLHLANTTIAELPESIMHLQNLRILDISKTGITKLPRAIGMLAKLQELRVSGCENLKGLPSDIGELISLNMLELDNFRYCEKLQEVPELPSSLTALGVTCQSPPLPHLSQLTLLNKLTLSDCSWLECLPELPVGLSMLYITDCGKLKALTNLSYLKHLSELILEKCLELTEVTGLEGLQSLSNLQLRQCPKIYRLGAVKSLESLRGSHLDEAFLDSSKLTIAKVPQLEGSLDLSNSKILQETNAGSCVNLVEIQGLGGSKSSLALDISECTSPGQSQDLSSLEYLRELHVTNCTNLTEIRGLEGLEPLRILDISGCTSLIQLMDLSNLKNLRNFCAADCKNLVDIQGIDGSESLRNLKISGCTSLRQSPDLSNLKNLLTFEATNCENLVEIRGLDGLVSLIDLRIFGCTSLRQLPDLSNLKNLRRLDAANCKNVVEIRGLDGPKFLYVLNISGCTSIGQSLDLSNLRTLGEFYAANCENLVEIRGHDSFKSLKIMDISGCTSLRQLLNLSNHKNLSDICAANCKNLVEIRGIDGLEFLCNLDISGCTSLRQSINLSTLRYMRGFRAANCKNLVKIQGPDRTKYLREWDISGCTSIEQSLNL